MLNLLMIFLKNMPYFTFENFAWYALPEKYPVPIVMDSLTDFKLHTFDETRLNFKFRSLK